MEQVPPELLEQYSADKKKFEKALETVRQMNVKRHIFKPSGREIWTVLGGEGDQLVDDSQPYCSCRHFHFKVLGGKDLTCYHLLSISLAKKLEKYEEIVFHDEEHYDFLRALIKDLYHGR